MRRIAAVLSGLALACAGFTSPSLAAFKRARGRGAEGSAKAAAPRVFRGVAVPPVPAWPSARATVAVAPAAVPGPVGLSADGPRIAPAVEISPVGEAGTGEAWTSARDLEATGRDGTATALRPVRRALDEAGEDRIRDLPVEEAGAYGHRLMDAILGTRAHQGGQVPAAATDGGSIGLIYRHSATPRGPPRLLRPSSRDGGRPRALNPAAHASASGYEWVGAVPESGPQAPPARVPEKGRRAIRFLLVASTLSMAVFALQNLFAIPLMSLAAVGKSQYATVAMLSSLVSIPLAFVNGWLVDRLPFGAILLGSTVILTAVSLATAALYLGGGIQFWTLLALAIATQAALTALMVGESSFLAKILGDHPQELFRKSAQFDLRFAGVGLLSSWAGAWIVGGIGLLGTFLLYAGTLALLVIPFYWLATRNYSARGDWKARPGIMDTWGVIWRSPHLKMLALLMFAAVFLIFPLRNTLTPIIASQLHLGSGVQPAQVLGTLNAGIYGGMFLSALFNVFLSRPFSRSRLLQGASLAFAAFGVFLIWPQSVTAMALGLAVIFLAHGIGSNVLKTSYMEEAKSAHSQYVGRLMGVYSSLFGMGIFAGTWLLKATVDAAGYPALLYVLGIPYALVLALYLASPALLVWTRRRASGASAVRRQEER